MTTNEYEFAQQDDMTVAFIAEDDVADPSKRQPVIYKKSSGDRLTLTAAEGRWLANILSRMMPR